MFTDFPILHVLDVPFNDNFIMTEYGFYLRLPVGEL